MRGTRGPAGRGAGVAAPPVRRARAAAAKRRRARAGGTPRSTKSAQNRFYCTVREMTRKPLKQPNNRLN